MYTAVQEKLRKSLEGFQPATCCTLATAAAAAGAGKQARAAASGVQIAAGLELCRLSKLLLIAGGCQQGRVVRLCVCGGGVLATCLRSVLLLSHTPHTLASWLAAPCPSELCSSLLVMFNTRRAAVLVPSWSRPVMFHTDAVLMLS